MTPSDVQETPRLKALVTGATGYVGGRLVPRLIQRTDCDIRVFVRDSSRIRDRGWKGIEVIEGDALNEVQVRAALSDVHTAYYLIHSMRSGESEFAERDRRAAEIFGRVAKECGVRRIIYLGGLGNRNDPRLSRHLSSRQETGDSLRKGGVPVVEFQAGMIIGSGSLSFEMLRYLTERVPVMIAPKWVNTRSQPISIRDILSYLLEALDLESGLENIYEIGGPDILSYEQMIRIYAEERKLKRKIIRVPVLTPRLSSYWVNIVTPLPASFARPLIDGLKNELLVSNDMALKNFKTRPLFFRDALRLALDRTLSEEIETRWSTSLSSVPSGVESVKLQSREGLIIEERAIDVSSPPETTFAVVVGIGGDKGWPYADFLWQCRGWIDRILGGVGMRRGRRSATELHTGEALDFWRVEVLEKNSLLRLRAEMKVPGKAWLEFQIEPTSTGCRLFQRAIFEPRGLWGLVYWYSVYPLHSIIFKGMVRSISELSSRAKESPV